MSNHSPAHHTDPILAERNLPSPWRVLTLLAGLLVAVVFLRRVGRPIADVLTAFLDRFLPVWLTMLVPLGYYILLAGLYMAIVAALIRLAVSIILSIDPPGRSSDPVWSKIRCFPKASRNLKLTKSGVQFNTNTIHSLAGDLTATMFNQLVVPVMAGGGIAVTEQFLTAPLEGLFTEIAQVGFSGPLMSQLIQLSIVGGVPLVVTVIALIAYRRSRNFRLEIPREPVPPGSSIPIILSQKYGKPVRHASIRIVCLESCFGALEHSRDWSQVLHSEVIELPLSKKSAKSGRIVKTEMRIPPDAMHSFEAGFHRIRWYFEIKLKDENGKEHEFSFDFRVAPEYNLRIAPHADDGMMEQDSPILEDA